MTSKAADFLRKHDFSDYEGKWIAVRGDGEILSADNPDELEEKVGNQENFIITKVPEGNRTLIL